MHNRAEASVFDVIVVGAGAAGLIAASELVRAGRSVVLLEARDRIGGRIWTRHEPGLAVPIELGAEFIHGHAQLARSLLQRAGMRVIESSGSQLTLEHGVARAAGSSFARIQQAVRSCAAILEQQDMSFDCFVEQHLGALLTPAERAQARTLAEGFDAADPARASARALVAEWTGDTLGNVPQSRPQAGYAALLAALDAALPRERLRLQLNATVQQVNWRRGSVEVCGSYLQAPFRLSAPRALITLPLGVLQAPQDAPGAVRFDPPLDAKQQPLGALASGAVVKVLLRFANAFWESFDGGAYRDVSFLHALDAPVRTFWTQAPVLHAPLMVAWAGGPRAQRLGARPAQAIVLQALESLQRLFGPDVEIASQLEAFYYHDWQQDPFARGAYSYVLVGGSAARAALAEPLSDTLYFAGEATDSADEAGTVTGALESGVRAAQQLLAV